MAIEIHDGLVVRVLRHFEHPPEMIYDAFTKPDLAARWMWAGLGSDPSAEMDVRIGGRYRVSIVADPDDDSWPGPERAMRGVYVEIEPNRRLVYTLHWDADVGYNRSCLEVMDEAVTVDITPAGSGCDLVLTHVGLPGDMVSAEAHGAGIDASLDFLAAILAGR